MPKTVFISDLHLAANQPKTTDAFLRFATNLDPSVEALYVLGDLFEYWIGDDDIQQPFHQTIVNTFADIAKRGTALFFMHGNRDFLLGQVFCEACKGKLLPDPTLIELYGTPTLLMHGDTLCTDDTEYMRFRALVRSHGWQVEFLGKSLTERRTIVEDLRRKSEQATSMKPAEITDVSTPAVEAMLRDYHYPALIHGHTHRPFKHTHHVDERTCERWVLPDWYDNRGGYLEATPAGWKTSPLL